MIRHVGAAMATLSAALVVHPMTPQDQPSGPNKPGSPGSPTRPAPGQPDPATRPITPPASMDPVELRGEVVSLPEFFGIARSPGSTPPASPSTPGTSPSTRDGPWGMLVRNDARSGNRDQLYILLTSSGDHGTPDRRTTQETAVRGRIVERAGIKALVMTSQLSTPETPTPGTNPGRTPGSPGSTPGGTPPSPGSTPESPGTTPPR